MEDEPNSFMRFAKTVGYMIDTPVTYFREKVVEANQQKYPWYHQKFRRVPTIAECYKGDSVCYFEADAQFQRDKRVDDQILGILRHRYEECAFGQPEEKEICDQLHKTYDDAAAIWFAKYGDLGGVKTEVVSAFMKQKHRMLWERRHGPVGTGMKDV